MKILLPICLLTCATLITYAQCPYWVCGLEKPPALGDEYPNYSGQRPALWEYSKILRKDAPSGICHSVCFSNILYEVFLTSKGAICGIISRDKGFKTPEGIAIGDSYSIITSRGVGRAIGTTDCVPMVVMLESGWIALLGPPEGCSNEDYPTQAYIISEFWLVGEMPIY